MGGESRIAHENEVFEDARALEEGGTADLGKPTPADATPKPADPRTTGEDADAADEDADAADEDVDETLAGGLQYPDRDRV